MTRSTARCFVEIDKLRYPVSICARLPLGSFKYLIRRDFNFEVTRVFLRGWQDGSHELICDGHGLLEEEQVCDRDVLVLQGRWLMQGLPFSKGIVVKLKLVYVAYNPPESVEGQFVFRSDVTIGEVLAVAADNFDMWQNSVKLTFHGTKQPIAPNLTCQQAKIVQGSQLILQGVYARAWEDLPLKTVNRRNSVLECSACLGVLDEDTLTLSCAHGRLCKECTENSKTCPLCFCE